MYGIIHLLKWKGLLTVGRSDSIHVRISRKNQQTTKDARGDEKYFVLILLGYQSIASL